MAGEYIRLMADMCNSAGYMSQLLMQIGLEYLFGCHVSTLQMLQPFQHSAAFENALQCPGPICMNLQLFDPSCCLCSLKR